MSTSGQNSGIEKWKIFYNSCILHSSKGHDLQPTPQLAMNVQYSIRFLWYGIRCERQVPQRPPSQAQTLPADSADSVSCPHQAPVCVWQRGKDKSHSKSHDKSHGKSHGKSREKCSWELCFEEEFCLCHRLAWLMLYLLCYSYQAFYEIEVLIGYESGCLTATIDNSHGL